MPNKYSASSGMLVKSCPARLETSLPIRNLRLHPAEIEERGKCLELADLLVQTKSLVAILVVMAIIKHDSTPATMPEFRNANLPKLCEHGTDYKAPLLPSPQKAISAED